MNNETNQGRNVEDESNDDDFLWACAMGIEQT